MSSFAVVILLGVILAILTIGVWWRKANVLEMLVLGVVYWFCAWILSAMALFVADEFRLFRCACATAALLLVVAIPAVLIRRKQDCVSWQKRIQPQWDIRHQWVPLLLCACGLVLVAVKHGYFGMGQDEGVYQTVAINFMNGITDRQQDFTEYHLLDESQQSTFLQTVENRLVGYDLNPAGYPDTVYDTTVSPVSGIYHGIPTYASILAMWGTLFGMAQMQGVQTLFYCCGIFLVWMVCRNLKLRTPSGFLACAVTAASPVVVWVSKSALTEGFLLVLLASFLYFLTDADHPNRQWLSILPVAVFGCYHVSIYTMVPLFLVIYGGMYWLTRRKSFAVLMPVTIVGYLISFFAMRHVQPFYTMNNYKPFFAIGVKQKDLPVLVPLVCAIALVLTVAYLLVVKKCVHKKYAHLTPEAYLAKFQQSRLGFFLVEVLLVVLVLYILAKCLVAENALATLRNSAFWGYVCCTGIFLLIIAWVVGVIRPRFYLETPQRLVLLVAAFYCVLFYSAFLRFEVEYFYYYSRYLAPFIPIAAIFGAMTLDRFRAKMTVPVMVAGLAVVAPYDRFLAMMQDDTRMEWDVLEETAAEISSQDCIIIDDDNMWTMYLSLRAMTGAAVYPVLEDDVTVQAQTLAETYENVYYLGTGDWSDSFSDSFRLVYENKVTQYNDDNVSGRGTITPFPLEYQETTKTVTLYRYAEMQLTYAAAACAEADYRGFGTVEGAFCWSNSDTAYVRCQLEKADYTLTLTMGCQIDLKTLEMESYPVTILVNGETAGTVTVTPENNGGSLSLTVPAALIEDGQNIITLCSETWEASRVAAGDGRTLGFPLEALTFS